MFVHLAIAGRESRSLILNSDQIESISAVSWDDSYERDARARVRTKSGDVFNVREEPYQIELQMTSEMEQGR